MTAQQASVHAMSRGGSPAELPSTGAASADAVVAEPGEARKRLAAWLLGGRPQPFETDPREVEIPHAGGVAGSVDVDGSADYLYPEITGYYLQWLASSVTRADRAELSDRAVRAQRWLSRWVAIKPLPPTRMYVRRGPDDWRNRAIFCFDHAMVLRGLSSAARRGLLTLDATLVAAVCAQLETLVASDGMLDACRAHGSPAELPRRWSTRRGGYLAKAAAGIMQLPDLVVISPRLAAAAQASYAASLRAAVNEPHDETHPFLYACEGLLARFDSDEARAALPAMLGQLEAIIDDYAQTRSMSEARNQGGRPRLDIVAQTVRVVCALKSVHAASPNALRAAQDMLDTLAHAVRSDGSMPFALDRPDAESNTWTAMFTEQAFAYAANSAVASPRGDFCLV